MDEIRPVAFKHSFYTRCDWGNVIFPHRYNWVDFCFFNFTVRWDKMYGKIDVDFGLLGFVLSGSYVYDENTPARKDLQATMERLERGEDEV